MSGRAAGRGVHLARGTAHLFPRGANRPIGVFDSGVGGLTVFRALKKRLPHESILYFGDTAHVPYGSKSKEAVTRFSLTIGKFLASRDIKLLIVACNTASALALPDLKKKLKMPVLGVIEPGARAARAAANRKRSVVGVIATEATIASGSYEQSLKRLMDGVRVVGAACPLFVPLVEEGWWSHPVTRAVAREYLVPLKRAGAESVILGCTHYPLVKPVLRSILGKSVRLIDSADEVAREADNVLTFMNLKAKGKPSYRFFASDGPKRFMRLANRFLGANIKKVEVHSFD